MIRRAAPSPSPRPASTARKTQTSPASRASSQRRAARTCSSLASPACVTSQRCYRDEIMIAALLLATLPTLTQLHTGAPALGNGAGVSKFTFFVAGDNRPDKGDGPADGFTAVVTEMQMASAQPVFVFWGGDTIKGKSSSDAKKQYPIALKVFAKLNVPVFNTPGNHELNKKGSGACNDALDSSGKLLADYTSLMGPPYGVFQYGNSAFISVNTDDSLGNIAPPKGCYNGFVSKSQRDH